MIKSHRSIQLISVRWWNATAYYAISLTNSLNKAKHLAIVCGKKNSPPLKKAKDFDMPIFDSIDLESKNPLFLFISYHNLLKLVKSRKIDLINAHRPEDHLIGGLIKKRLKIPLIRTIGDVRSPKNNFLNRWLHLRATDYFIFSCKANKERYGKIWHIPEEKCAVIYAPVDTNYFKLGKHDTKFKTKLGIDSKKTIFGLFARLSPVKDHLTFLKAASILQRTHKNIEFVISGKAVEISHSDLHELAAELGIIDNIHILEEVDDIRDLINLIDVGIVSSKGSEVICRIGAEFLSMSTPVIVTNVNVLPEMITHGQEGFIVPAKSPQQMANKMELLLDPTLRETMKMNARKKAINNFSLDKTLEDTLQIYRRCVQSGFKVPSSRYK